LQAAETARAIDQRPHCFDVLAEKGQGEGGIDNDVRVVAGRFQAALREIDAFAPVRLGVGPRPIRPKSVTAHRGLR
jgi:hypothetical protein